MPSIETSLRYAWEKFKANLEISILATLLTMAIGFLGDRVHWSIAIGAAILSIIIRIGYIKIFLRISDGESPKFQDLFQEYQIFWRYLGASILSGLAIVIGTVLLIVPGLILAVRLAFTSFIIVETNASPMAALKESFAITEGNFWKLLLFFIVLGLLNLAGFLVIGVGLLVSIPVSTLAAIYVYRELSKSKAGLIVETQTPQT